jgi:hypothetical protein
MSVDQKVLSFVADAPGHLLKDLLSEMEPLVEKPPSTSVFGPQVRELRLEPPSRHGCHDPAAREEVEGRELLERDEWVPLRNDQCGDAELEPLGLGGEEAERDERLRDRAVDTGTVGGDDQVVCDPRGVEPRIFGCNRGSNEALGCEGWAVVRKDQTEVKRQNGDTLSPVSRVLFGQPAPCGRADGR